MHIESFELNDLASFEKSGLIQLSPMMNLFIGVNNSGKSSLLRSLVFPLEDNRHIRQDGSERFDGPKTEVKIRLKIGYEELVRRCSMAGYEPAFTAGDISGPQTQQNALLKLLDDGHDLSLDGVRRPGGSMISKPGGSISSLEASANPRRLLVARDNDGTFKVKSGASKDNTVEFFDNQNSESIFYFSPQRLNVGNHPYGLHTSLASDASNLPAFLAHISANYPAKFEKIQQHLRDIMPGVGRLRIAPTDGGFEVRVFPFPDNSGSDVSFSLEKSGTGVGQLTAILTAVVVFEQAVIVIDEISTFLHTSASKKLISLLQTEYEKHQYIISTHSSEVIFSAICPRIFKVWREGIDSYVDMIQLKTAQDAKAVADYLGFSMLDVFGNERMVWVEGQTEVLCFPMISRAFGHELGPEIGFSAVQVPSQFTSRRSKHKQIGLIYENAGKSLAPLLKGMAFGLDREDLSDEAVLRAERSMRKVRFLPRRCIENYLLGPSQIAMYLGILGETTTEALVADTLQNLAANEGFLAKSLWKGDLEDPHWLKKVDGASLLSKTFCTLTQNRFAFAKTRDTVGLVSTYLTQSKEKLDELNAFIQNLIRIAGKDTPL